MLAKSYQILGLPAGASLTQIKQAFRTKAKQLHPDRNPAQDAHQQFAALSEAYDYLLAYKSGRLSSSRRTGKKPRSAQSSRAQEDRRRAQSQARARAHAKMKYEAYQKTEHYKDSVAAEAGTALFTLILSALILSSPLIALITKSVQGMWIAVIAITITFPIWLDVVRRPSQYLNIAVLKESWSRIIAFEGVQIVASLIINGLLFCFIGLSTLIPLIAIVETLIVAITAGYVYAYFSKRWNYRWLFGLGLGPFIVLFTLLCNYVGSHSPVIEQYAYHQERTRYKDGSVQEDTLITLRGSRYEEYKGIRFFMNQTALGKHRHIAYTFEEGLLGWRVMTDFNLLK